MKTCCRCQQSKSFDCFDKKSKHKDGYEYYCKDCRKLNHQKYYQQDKPAYKARAASRKKALRAWFREYKTTLKCARCPESHVACLDFHHLDPSQKDMQVGQIIDRKTSKVTLLAEIAKCEVLCSNCHRKLHYTS